MVKSNRSRAGQIARKSVPKKPLGRSTAALSAPAPAARALPPTPPLYLGPAIEALALFQQGVSLVQRHAYGDASRAFEKLLNQHPDERAVLDRARVYLDLCQRELRRQPAAPKTVEERITAATAALNDGDEARAESLVKGVLSENARHDLALYLMAVVHARRGATAAAMSALSQAVAVSPEVRAQARYDADFESLRGLDAFQALNDPPQPAAATTLRKAKRR
jgi:uncharacterized protein HemY